MKRLDSSDWEKTQNTTTVTERQKTPRTYLKYSGIYRKCVQCPIFNL